MGKLRLGVIGALGAAAAMTATIAQRPSALGQTEPGQWEITGVPGSAAPIRQCVMDLAALARFEHRGKSCSAKVLKDGLSSIVIDYSCGGADFGRSEIKVITPRSLKISTQGISDSMPFNYVLQARRIGDCSGAASALRH